MLLDKKMEVVKLAMMLARSHCVLPSDVCGSIKTIENGFIKFCRANGNIVLPDKKSPEKESFDGAVVYDTLSGRFGYQCTIDLTALYPSCMMLLGLSTETYTYQLANRYEDYVSVMSGSDEMVTVSDVSTGEHVSAKASDVLRMIREDGMCISANGSIFNGEMGLLAAYVKVTFEMRKHYKNLMKTAATETERDQHDLFQKVLKIVCNSLYGAISNQYFRLFNIELARSITATGRMISKHQAAQASALVDDLVDMKEAGELY
jgi:DNA polymerase elongation subunit (family B)